MSSIDTCLDCSVPCTITIVCDPCALRRMERDGPEWFARVTEDAAAQYPDGIWHPKKAGHDGAQKAEEPIETEEVGGLWSLEEIA